MNDQKKLNFKGLFITEDGENFLCIRQFYVSDLETGRMVDGKVYQGRKTSYCGCQKEDK